MHMAHALLRFGSSRFHSYSPGSLHFIIMLMPQCQWRSPGNMANTSHESTKYYNIIETKQSTTIHRAYFMGYSVYRPYIFHILTEINAAWTNLKYPPKAIGDKIAQTELSGNTINVIYPASALLDTVVPSRYPHAKDSSLTFISRKLFRRWNPTKVRLFHSLLAQP